MDTDPGFPLSDDCDYRFCALLYSELFLSPYETAVHFGGSAFHVVGEDRGSAESEDGQVGHCLPVDDKGCPSHPWCFLRRFPWSTGFWGHPSVQLLQVQLGIFKGQNRPHLFMKLPCYTETN